MITENLSKQEFIIRVLERDVRNIYKAQLLIATKNVYLDEKTGGTKKRKGALIGRNTGAMINSLENPDYTIQANGGKVLVAAQIRKSMRFFDMKRLGNWQIYNRQVWGILYNNSLNDIRFNYGQQIHDEVGRALDDVFRDN
jgi:hypothetical protein